MIAALVPISMLGSLEIPYQREGLRVDIDKILKQWSNISLFGFCDCA